jgi:hypothetical protein
MDQPLSAPRLSCSIRTWHLKTTSSRRTETSQLQRLLSCSWGSLLQKWPCPRGPGTHYKVWSWCVRQSRAFLGLLGSRILCRLLLRSLLRSFLGSFLVSFLAIPSGSCEKGQSNLCLLCHIALLYISLVGILVGLESAPFLHCNEG